MRSFSQSERNEGRASTAVSLASTAEESHERYHVFINESMIWEDFSLGALLFCYPWEAHVPTVKTSSVLCADLTCRNLHSIRRYIVAELLGGLFTGPGAVNAVPWVELHHKDELDNLSLVDWLLFIKERAASGAHRASVAPSHSIGEGN